MTTYAFVEGSERNWAMPTCLLKTYGAEVDHTTEATKQLIIELQLGDLSMQVTLDDRDGRYIDVYRIGDDGVQVNVNDELWNLVENVQSETIAVHADG